ncbi:hypothetical protein OKW37_001729 [Paraburkholderia sp. MM5482-R2]
MMATLAPTVFAAGTYTEVWNPPEARACAPRHVKTTHKLAVHRHVVSHTVKVHARLTPTAPPKLMAKQRHLQEAVPANEPDTSDIPRQITPEGNVLRVTARGAFAVVSH